MTIHEELRDLIDQHAEMLAALKALSRGGEGKCWCEVQRPVCVAGHTDECILARAATAKSEGRTS